VTGLAKNAKIVGDFNHWSFPANLIKNLKNGAFTATLELEKEKAYQFRYVLNKNHWGNETEADKLVPSPYGDSENSVIIV
jgi:1,4-alpha-glucan branching enzyme